MKFKSQLLILSKNHLRLFLRDKKIIIFLSSLLLINILINVVSTVVLNSSEPISSKMSIISTMIILNSVFYLVFSIFSSIKIYLINLKNNIHLVELRFGYKLKNIYFSRIIMIILINLTYLLLTFIISLIFFAVLFIPNNILIYRAFISPFGWYAILILVALTITLFFSLFFSELVTSIAASFLMISFLITPPIIGLSTINTNQDNGDYYYRYLTRENHSKKLIDEIKKLKHGEELLIEFNQILYKRNFINEGPLLNLELIQDYTYYNEFVNYFSEKIKLIGDQSLIAWTNIQDFSPRSDIIEEKINPVYSFLKNKVSDDMKQWLKMMQNFSSNLALLKDAGFVRYDVIDEYDQNLKSKIQDVYLPEEYLFFKIFNTLLFNADINRSTNIEPSSGGTINDFGDDMRRILRLDFVKNIYNPLRHINLMFHSIDYDNYLIYNTITRLGLNAVVPNIRLLEDDDDKILKMGVRVEILYITYSLISFAIISLLYLRFKKTIKN